MNGIIEKGNNGLFNNEIEFVGKYAEMVRTLKEKKIFSSFRDIYIASAIVGFVNGKTESGKNTNKQETASIFTNEILKRRDDLQFIYRLIMLLKKESKFTIDDYKNRTFRDDPEDPKSTLVANMQIFNSYACGGLEYLYEKFSKLDDDDDKVNEIYKFVEDFQNYCKETPKLPDIEPEF